MIADPLFEAFVRAVAANKKTKRGPVTHIDWEKAGVPVDVGRMLTSVGGWRHGNFRFTVPSELETDRQRWNQLVEEFESARSDTWNHAFWNSGWYPLATSSVEIYAFDPIGCFGGAPGQIVSFDVKGGEEWLVFPLMSTWLIALTEGFESDAKDPLEVAHAWARANKAFTKIKLPDSLDERRSALRFEAGVGAWIELRHPDGRSWAIRARRDGYDLRIGDDDDAVIRKRICPRPDKEVRRLVAEQKAEGFAAAAPTA